MSKGEHGGIRERGMAERRARILDAAGELIVHGDLAALTMRALSDSAGVSVPTIYNLIGGRDEVLMALLERSGAIVEAELTLIRGAPIDRCFAIADDFVDRITAQRGILRSVFIEGLGPMLSDNESTPLRRYGVALGMALIEGIEDETIDGHTTVRLLVEHIVALMAMRVFRWVSSADPSDPERLRAEVTHAIALSLAAVATDASRPGVLERLTTARRTLAD